MNLLKNVGTNKSPVYVIDFHKIDELGYPVNIIISERGAKGKTFNAKEFLLDKILEGKNAKWMLNTNNQWEREAPKFILKNKQINPKWDPFVVKSNGVYLNNEEKIGFVSLLNSETEKGTRQAIDYLIYDEFNVAVQHLGVKQSFLFDNYLQTISDNIQVKINKHNKLKTFIFGNFKSLNSNLLTNMGIMSIKEEYTFINDSYGNPLIFIYVPVIDKKQVEAELAGDWTYQLSKLTGNADHLFLNDSLDLINGVDNNYKKQLNNLITVYYCDKSYLGVYKAGDKTFIDYLKEIPSDWYGEIICPNKADLLPDYIYTPLLKENLLSFINKNKIIFGSIVARDILLQAVRGGE